MYTTCTQNQWSSLYQDKLTSPISLTNKTSSEGFHFVYQMGISRIPASPPAKTDDCTRDHVNHGTCAGESLKSDRLPELLATWQKVGRNNWQMNPPQNDFRILRKIAASWIITAISWDSIAWSFVELHLVSQGRVNEFPVFEVIVLDARLCSSATGQAIFLGGNTVWHSLRWLKCIYDPIRGWNGPFHMVPSSGFAGPRGAAGQCRLCPLSSDLGQHPGLPSGLHAAMPGSKGWYLFSTKLEELV